MNAIITPIFEYKGIGNKIFTIIRNLDDISQNLNIQSPVLLNYLSKYFGTTTKDGSIKGHIDVNIINNLKT
jgi:hypothetical protein